MVPPIWMTALLWKNPGPHTDLPGVSKASRRSSRDGQPATIGRLESCRQSFGPSCDQGVLCSRLMRIAAALRTSTPLGSCRVCFRLRGRRRPWGQPPDPLHQGLPTRTTSTLVPPVHPRNYIRANGLTCVAGVDRIICFRLDLARAHLSHDSPHMNTPMHYGFGHSNPDTVATITTTGHDRTRCSDTT